jgi:hypothetical protein
MGTLLMATIAVGLCYFGLCTLGQGWKEHFAENWQEIGS